jgi:hypothetical protein
VVELRFRSIIQQTYGPTSWRYDLYVEGDELPVATGFVSGTKADVDAAILKAQEFTADNWDNRSNKPVVRQDPKAKS